MSDRPTTRLFAVYCEQYRAETNPIDRWGRATEARDFYAVCIAKQAIAGRGLSAEDVYCFHLFDRLRNLHHLRYRREAAEAANA